MIGEYFTWKSKNDKMEEMVDDIVEIHLVSILKIFWLLNS